MSTRPWPASMPSTDLGWVASLRRWLPRLAAALLLVLPSAALADLTAVEQAIRAAKAAQDAAQSDVNAAGAAKDALGSASGAAGSALKTANADGDSDSAGKSSGDAVKASADSASARRSAEQHAKAAQGAAQRGDTAKAGAEAKAAEDAAAAARTAADDAAKAAKAAADSAHNAERKAQLDSQLPDGPPKPTSDQEKKYKQQITDAGYDIQNVEDPAEKAAKKGLKDMKSLESAEQAEEDASEIKEGQVKPPDKPVNANFQVHGFFDVIIDLQLNPLQIPDFGIQVPEFKPEQGSKGRVFLHLVNDNPFDVVLTGVHAYLFGDAVTGFEAFSGSQTLAANDLATVLVGVLDFGGPLDSFTAIDFSFDTTIDHPGLGPEVMLNVAMTPEPASVTLVLLGLACAGWQRRPVMPASRFRARCAGPKVPGREPRQASCADS